MKCKGRFRKFVAKALTVLTAFSLFNCREPQVDKLPKNPAKEICAATSLCVSGITELPNGSFNSRLDPEKIDQDGDGNWISSNTILIKFKDGTSVDEIIGLFQELETQIVGYVPLINAWCIEVKTNSAQEIEKTIGLLSKNSHVEIAEPNIVLFPKSLDYELLAEKDTTGIWGYERIQLAEAYEYLEKHKVVLKPVKVAVLDTSFQLDHPELEGRFLPGYDFADNDSDPSMNDVLPIGSYTYSHGTEVSGIIAAKNNNSVEGVDNPMANGVVFNSKLLPLKVFTSSDNPVIRALKQNGISFSFIIYNAINSAVDQDVDVVNLSLGPAKIPLIAKVVGDAPLFLMRIAVENAYSKGLTIVAAAGNENTDATHNYPASYPKVISVGNSDVNDGRYDDGIGGSNFSQKGDEDVLTLAAPGAGIFCTEPKDTYWEGCTGTSISAPFVSGLAALLKSIKPSLTPDEIRTIMISSADKICVDYPDETCADVADNPERREAHTWNRINVLNAVKKVVGIEDEVPKEDLVKWKLEFDSGDMSTGAHMLLDNDVLYITSSSTGKLYAISKEGELRWELEIPGYHSGASIGTNGNIYVWTGNHLGTFSSSAHLLSVTPEGIVEWTINEGDIQANAFGMPSISSSGMIYTNSVVSINAINPDGTLGWKFGIGLSDYNPRSIISKEGKIHGLTNATPSYIYTINPDGTLDWEVGDLQLYGPLGAVGSDGTIYVSSYTDPHTEIGELLALSPIDGSTRWSFGLERWSMASPIVEPDGTIYMNSCDNILYAIDSDGNLKWKFEEGQQDVCTPTSAESAKFLRPLWLTPAITQDGTIYLDDPSQGFFGIDSIDGTLKWEFEPQEGGNTVGTPMVGPDGTIYTIEYVGESALLYAIEGDSPLADSAWPKYQHDNRNSGSGE